MLNPIPGITRVISLNPRNSTVHFLISGGRSIRRLPVINRPPQYGLIEPQVTINCFFFFSCISLFCRSFSNWKMYWSNFVQGVDLSRDTRIWVDILGLRLSFSRATPLAWSLHFMYVQSKLNIRCHLVYQWLFPCYYCFNLVITFYFGNLYSCQIIKHTLDFMMK